MKYVAKVLDSSTPAARKRWEDEWYRDVHASLYPAAKVGAWKAWAAFVREIEVELRPGGRAQLRHPELAGMVEIEWETEGPGVVFRGCRFEPEPEALPEWSGVDLGAFEMALHESLGQRFRDKGPHESLDPFEGVIQPPAAGKPIAVSFYRQLLREYERLLAEGNAAPVKELASHYKRPDGTVKSWLSRGREYLREGDSI